MKNLIIAEEAVQEGFDLPQRGKDGADAAERGAVLRDLIAVVRFFMTSDWMIAKHHNQPAAGDMLYLFTVFPPAQAQISFLNPPTKNLRISAEIFTFNYFLIGG